MAGLWGGPLLAQDPAAASAAAASATADERYERMAADIQALQAANEALQARVNNLQDDLQKVRDDQARLANNSNVSDDLKRLADKIEEVDRKREEDKAAIAGQIRDSIAALEKSLQENAAPARHAAVHVSTNATDGAPVDGFSYTIKEGDSLSAILKAYNVDFKSKGLKPITLKQAKEANPEVDWNRLAVGQKIVIPRPAD